MARHPTTSISEQKASQKQARCDKNLKLKKPSDMSPSCTLRFTSPDSLLKSTSTNSGEDTNSVAPSPDLAKTKHCDTPQILASVLGLIVGDKLAYSDNVKQTLVQQFGTYFTELGCLSEDLMEISAGQSIPKPGSLMLETGTREYDQLSNLSPVAGCCHVRCDGQKVKSLLDQVYHVRLAGVFSLQ